MPTEPTAPTAHAQVTRARFCVPAREAIKVDPDLGRDAERLTLGRLKASGEWRTSTILKCFYADHPGACWSVPQLAEELDVSVDTIKRALRTIRRMPEVVLVELPGPGPKSYRAQRPMRRAVFWRASDKCTGGVSPLLPKKPCTDLESECRSVSFPRAYTRTCVNAVREIPPVRLREPRAQRRRRHRQRRKEGGAGFDPVVLPPVLLAALSARFPGELAAILRVNRCTWARRHPAESLLAARTLLERPTPRSLEGYYRGLIAEAVRGALLCDAAADAERVRDAEAAERARDPWHPSCAPPRPPPDPDAARAAAIRDRLALVDAAHPHRAAWAAELAALEADVRSARRRVDELPLPTDAELARAEYGGGYGRIVYLGDGTIRAVVQPERPERVDHLAEMNARLDALDLDALDRPDEGPVIGARVTPAACADDGNVPP